jgi:Flp pilus assembly protein TadD
VGLCTAATGDFVAAFEELTAASRELPTSIRVQRSLAEVCERLDRPDGAERALLRVAELTPGSAEAWIDLAGMQLRTRNLQAGFRAIAVAESLAGPEEPRVMGVRAGLETQAGNRQEALRLLQRVLLAKPDDPAARYQFAYTLDMDHRTAEAEKAYLRVLAVDPAHVLSLLCLANLNAGASSGQCRGCDEAYAAHPECLDLGKAERHLIRCLELDRGQTEWVTESARDVALRLKDRSGVIALLDRLSRTPQKTQAVLRLEELRRRLLLVEGR